MSPNGLSSGFDETFIFSSSDSSDSEFLFQEDVKTRENHINKQWEAIERTLYQEPGQQVTDPDLLKECKLWRETFPHFRIRGTKIDVCQRENKPGETDESVQTLGKHFNLKKLEEKREKIKKEIVEALVERLIPKITQKKFLGWEKPESANWEGNHQSGVQITEIDDDNSEAVFKSSPNGFRNVENSDFPIPVGPERESYFERGKSRNKGNKLNSEVAIGEEKEKNFFDFFDSLIEESQTAIKLPETAESANSRKVGNSCRGNLTIKNSDKSPIERFKPGNRTRSDSLSSIAKPFEMKNKIDKKYEGLVEKIMERQLNAFDARRHCRTSSSGLEKSYQESLMKLRIESGFEEQMKKRNTAKINKFSNNWLGMSELSSYKRSASDHVFQERKSKSNRTPKNFYTDNLNQKEMDEKFLEELKKEMALNYKRPSKKSGVFEQISLRRPKPFSSTTEMSVKSSNSGDLSKRNKKEIKSGQSKRGLESGTKELSVKSRVKHNNPNGSKGNKRKENQSSLLPPIETGIICTELTGRPKIGFKNPSKK